eukprot:ctg_681.g356
MGSAGRPRGQRRRGCSDLGTDAAPQRASVGGQRVVCLVVRGGRSASGPEERECFGRLSPANGSVVADGRASPPFPLAMTSSRRHLAAHTSIAETQVQEWSRKGVSTERAEFASSQKLRRKHPHGTRRSELLRAHPEVSRLYGVNKRSALYTVLLVLLQVAVAVQVVGRWRMPGTGGCCWRTASGVRLGGGQSAHSVRGQYRARGAVGDDVSLLSHPAPHRVEPGGARSRRAGGVGSASGGQLGGAQSHLVGAVFCVSEFAADQLLAQDPRRARTVVGGTQLGDQRGGYIGDRLDGRLARCRLPAGVERFQRRTASSGRTLDPRTLPHHALPEHLLVLRLGQPGGVQHRFSQRAPRPAQHPMESAAGAEAAGARVLRAAARVPLVPPTAQGVYHGSAMVPDQSVGGRPRRRRTRARRAVAPTAGERRARGKAEGKEARRERQGERRGGGG